MSGVVPLHAEVLWIEGESASANKMNRHPWWYDQVKKVEFSGGDFLSNFSDQAAGEVDYTITDHSRRRGGQGPPKFYVGMRDLLHIVNLHY